MNDLHYKSGLPIWIDKDYQVLHGVKLFTEEALVIYRYCLGQEQKIQLENDLGHFRTSNLTYFPKTTRFVQKGKDLFDFVVEDVVGQRLVSSHNRCSILTLYQIYQAYNELRKLYQQGYIGQRDIGVNNLTLDSKQSVIVLDFGLSYLSFLNLQGTRYFKLDKKSNLSQLLKVYSIYWPPEILLQKQKFDWEYSLGMIYFVLLTGLEVEKKIKDIIQLSLKSRKVDAISIRKSIYTFLIDYGKRSLTQQQMYLVFGLLGFQKQILWANVPNQQLFVTSGECFNLIHRKNVETIETPLKVSTLPSATIAIPRSKSSHAITDPDNQQIRLRENAKSQHEIGQSTPQKLQTENGILLASPYSKKPGFHQSSYHTPVKNDCQTSISTLIETQPTSTQTTKSEFYSSNTQNTSFYVGKFVLDSQKLIDSNFEENRTFKRMKFNLRLREKSTGSQQRSAANMIHKKNSLSQIGTLSRRDQTENNKTKLSQVRSTYVSHSQSMEFKLESSQSIMQRVTSCRLTEENKSLLSSEQFSFMPSNQNMTTNESSRNLTPSDRIRSATYREWDVSINGALDLLKESPKQDGLIKLVRIDDFAIELKEYKTAIKQYKLIGEAVVETLSFQENGSSQWIIPLFLVFKRMFQVRKDIEVRLCTQNNILNIQNFSLFCQTHEYVELKEQVKEENKDIELDFKKLLKLSLNRSLELDTQKQKKLEWFLNEDLSLRLQDQLFVYVYSQIIPFVKQQIKTTKSEKQILALNKLHLKFLATLIITENPLMRVPPWQFNYDIFVNEYLSYNQEDKLQVVTEILEQTVNTLKTRLVEKGYKLN